MAFFSACTPKSDNQTMQPQQTASENYEVIADTITYSVLLKNDDPYNSWQENALKGLDREALTNYLFEAVYQNELKPIDYFSQEPLSIADVKALEAKEEFSRDRVAKAQFEEIWYLAPESNKMRKEVYSIMIAYEAYNDSGRIKGYKPAFKVYLNQ
jgi:hypothetical protein